MWRPILVSILLAVVGCGVAHQPESRRTVAAFEVPLPFEQERNEFLSLVRREAEAQGLHLDAATSTELESISDGGRFFTQTMRATVYRGPTDDHAEVVMMDMPDHLGQVWLMFSKGEDPELARAFRDRLMLKITQRWPETLSLPVMPTGAIPNRYQLRRTPDGYKLDPDEVSGYGVSRTSPLVLQP